jgi:hypothetical protein
MKRMNAYNALSIKHSDTLAKLMNNIGKLEMKSCIDNMILYRSRDGLRRPLLLDLVEFALHLNHRKKLPNSRYDADMFRPSRSLMK